MNHTYRVTAETHIPIYHAVEEWDDEVEFTITVNKPINAVAAQKIAEAIYPNRMIRNLEMEPV